MDEETTKILDIFEQLNAVPRRSKHEEKISRWLLDRASALGLKARADTSGNVVIEVPGSSGRENAPAVVLQGHMDMVCEKEPGYEHDFDKDPIVHVIEGEWLRAKGTSLGADNGIALAYCLAIAERRDLVHPPLELLFTVDEETGLNGAKALSPDFIRGRILLNLDSEDEGVFTIGCAGGRDAILTFEPERLAPEKGLSGIEITVGGLAGGHSGAEIHRHRANAIKLLARTLSRIIFEPGVRLLYISGGSARNAIPRNARAVIAAPEGRVKKIIETVHSQAAIFTSEYAAAEKDMLIDANVVSLDGLTAFTDDFAGDIVRLLRVIPTGLRDFSSAIPDLVETSSNLALVSETDGKLVVITSQRSSIDSKLEEISGDVEIAGHLAGAHTHSENSYPAWPPDISSPLLERAKEVYKQLFSSEAKVEAIHAGLECAVIGSIYGGMDMISLGPTVRNPHSPSERVHLPSIVKTWRLLVALLESYR